jgi:hypothetical protein
MRRKSAPKPDDPAQSQRFLDTAKEVGAHTDDKALERALNKVATQRRRQDERPKRSE